MAAMIAFTLPMRATASTRLVQTQASHPLAFVSNEVSHDISVVDLTLSKTIATIPVAGRARGIRLSADNRTLYVAASTRSASRLVGQCDLAVIDVASRKVVHNYRDIGSDPEQFAVTPDGHFIYASNEDGGTATAIDTRTGKHVATLIVGIEPEGVATSPDRPVGCGDGGDEQ